MFAARSKDRDSQHAQGTSITQRLARAAAIHPWRVVAAWGLILAVSVVTSEPCSGRRSPLMPT
jgi:RND superfamily putative drug exporter